MEAQGNHTDFTRTDAMDRAATHWVAHYSADAFPGP